MSFINEQKKKAKIFDISDQMIEKYIVESTIDMIKQKISNAIKQNKNSILIIGCILRPMDYDYDTIYTFIDDAESRYSEELSSKAYLEYARWNEYNGGYHGHIDSLYLLYREKHDGKRKLFWESGYSDFVDKHNLDISAFIEKLKEFDKQVISGNNTLNNIEKSVYKEVMNLGVKDAEICMKYGWIGYKNKSIFSLKKHQNMYKIYFKISW